MSITGLKEYLWTAGILFNVCLLAILVYKRQILNFPVFSALICFGVFRTVWLFIIRSHYGDVLYSHTYYSFALLDAGLQLAFIYEIASKVFRPRGRWAIDMRGALLVCVVVCIAVAAVLAYLQKPDGDDLVQVLSRKIGFFSVMLNAALFAGLVALSSKAGLNWKSHVASIATGMAVYCFAGIAIELFARFVSAEAREDISRLLIGRQFIYLACQVYWGYSLLQPEPSPRRMSPRMEGQVAALREAVIKRRSVRS